MLAVKIIGAGLICLCGFLAGYRKAQLLDLRAKLLDLMTEFIMDNISSIKYKRENAIRLICQTASLEKYTPLKLNLKEVEPPEWPTKRENALSDMSEELCYIVSGEEINYFKDAIKSVGEQSARLEEEHLNFYLEKLKCCADKAHEQSAKNKKLYIGIGLFAGSALSIILL